MQPTVTHTVRCGLGKFELDDNGVVTQYDHNGAVVGIFKASDTPTLLTWIRTTEERPGRGPITLPAGGTEKRETRLPN
jgi:hypothetical protein